MDRKRLERILGRTLGDGQRSRHYANEREENGCDGRQPTLPWRPALERPRKRPKGTGAR